MKTYKGWEESGIEDYFDYVDANDEVDQETVDYFMETVPPAKLERGYLQYGEPLEHKYDSIKDCERPVFGTFMKIGNTWIYCGRCFYAESNERD